MMTRRETARANASFTSLSDSSPCSMRLATIQRRRCCLAMRGENMWLAHILARCLALLQFRHSTSAATLQSLSVCTVLPHLLHLPWKKASAFSFFDEESFGRWFLAWFLFCALPVFLFTAYALSLLCSLQRCDLSQPWASFLMNCQVTPTPCLRSSLRNCRERQWVKKTMAMISCWVMSVRSHSSAMSRILFDYWTIAAA